MEEAEPLPTGIPMGSFRKGSGETWLACLGAGIRPMGEMKEEEQIYARQFAATISKLLGETSKQIAR